MVIFKNPHDSSIYPCFQRTSCDVMKAVGGMSIQQDPVEIDKLKCQHSEVCEILIGDQWQQQWDLDMIQIRNANETYNVLLHQEIESVVFRNNDIFLGAVLTREGKIRILYTINRSQKFPFCSSCPKQKCKCFKLLDNGIREEMRLIVKKKNVVSIAKNVRWRPVSIVKYG